MVAVHPERNDTGTPTRRASATSSSAMTHCNDLPRLRTKPLAYLRDLSPPVRGCPINDSDSIRRKTRREHPASTYSARDSYPARGRLAAAALTWPNIAPQLTANVNHKSQRPRVDLIAISYCDCRRDEVTLGDALLDPPADRLRLEKEPNARNFPRCPRAVVGYLRYLCWLSGHSPLELTPS